MRRAAIVASVLLHVAAMWGLRSSARSRPPRPPPAFAIDIAPAPPKAEALAPERAPEPVAAAAAPVVDPGPPIAAPPVAGYGLADAGVDAELVDAAAPIDARRRPRVDAGLDAGLDAGVDAMLVAEADAGGAADGGEAVAIADDGGPDGAAATAAVGDGGGDGGGQVAVAGDGGLGGDGGATAVGAADPSGSATAKPSAGTGADLRRFFPHGHVVSVLVRLDRLRDTEWAPRVDAIFGPMPDYRSLVGDTGVKLTETFETLAISTPSPRDATATTLVVRARATPPALRDMLDADDGPVAWSAVVGGALGRRAPSPRLFPGDRRVFLQWKLGWTALAHPGDLGGLLAPRAGDLDVEAPPAALPAWLDQVATIEAEAGEPTGPALMATASGVFPDHLPIPYGSGGDLPGPDRVTVTLELDPNGFLVRGNVRFPDESAAVMAEDLIARLRTEILGDRITKFALGRAGALNAITGLSVVRTGRRLAFATSISIRDAREFLSVVSTLVTSYFAAQGEAP